MNELGQAGNFRGDIVEYGLDEANSGAMAILIKVKIGEIFSHEDGEWYDWEEHDMGVRGALWVVKKDGKLNVKQVSALMTCAGWDGKFSAIVEGTWQPTPISFSVEPNDYNGETTYRIAWVNPFDSTPGGGGNVDGDKAKSLDGQLGAQMRGLAGNSARNTAKPKGLPPVKAKPADTASTPPEDEVPF